MTVHIPLREANKWSAKRHAKGEPNNEEVANPCHHCTQISTFTSIYKSKMR